MAGGRASLVRSGEGSHPQVGRGHAAALSWHLPRPPIACRRARRQGHPCEHARSRRAGSVQDQGRRKRPGHAHPSRSAQRLAVARCRGRRGAGWQHGSRFLRRLSDPGLPLRQARLWHAVSRRGHGGDRAELGGNSGIRERARRCPGARGLACVRQAGERRATPLQADCPHALRQSESSLGKGLRLR